MPWSSESITCSVPTISTGSWHHFALTNDGTKAQYYWDGSPITTTGVNTKGLDNLTNGLIIGDNITQNNAAFNGHISNVAFWSSSLTEDQILTIYNGGVPNSISSLSPNGWWSLSGDSYYNGSKWTCPDLSGSNNAEGDMETDSLEGNGPGSEANGVATNMNIPLSLKGNAPNSNANAFSVNMNFEDKTNDVPVVS